MGIRWMLCFVPLLQLMFFLRRIDSMRQPTLNQARALSSSVVYLSWEGPVDHPGGFRYVVYLKNGSSSFWKYKDLSGATWAKCLLQGLQENVRYTICVGVVDRFSQEKSSCDDVTIIHMPAQKGHVSKTDRKYLTKGGYYQGARHYWPFDYKTTLRDIKYSVDGKMKGYGVSIMGKSRGFLAVKDDGWVRLGHFKNDCLCDARHCRKDGLSVSLWVKLSRNETGRKVLLGSDRTVITNTTGVVIFQSTREEKRFISTVVFMEKRKWKCRFLVEPEKWFYLTVTWNERSGLRMYKDGNHTATRQKFRPKPNSDRRVDPLCAMSLSPPSGSEPLNAYYDDLVIWNYELNSTNIPDVFKRSLDPPKLNGCTSSDGKSVIVYIDDAENIYDIKGGHKISWRRRGDQEIIFNYTSARSYRIFGLEPSSEYVVKVQRRIGRNLLSTASEITCSTQLGVPLKPKNFVVRERAATYLYLQWDPPEQVFGVVREYKISYRVDDFTDSKWTVVFRGDVHTMYLEGLKPYTDYIIKLQCINDAGGGNETVLRTRTAEEVPLRPRNLRAILKGNSLVVRWKEPLETYGDVYYRLFVSVNKETTVACGPCGEYHRMNNVDQNTTYTFWVVAYNTNNDSRYVSQPSENITFSTPSFTPSVPRSVAANFTSEGIVVSWKKPEQPNGDIQHKLRGLVNQSGTVFCLKCGLRYVLHSTSRNTVYLFWVVAYNIAKGYESPASANVSVDTRLFVPSAPSQVTVNYTSDRILVSWNQSHVAQGIVQYNLLGMVNDSTKVFCSECGLHYSINDVAPDTNYSFWVIAYNAQNGYESASSNVVHFHVSSAEPSPPESLAAPDVQDSSAIVTWKPPAGTSDSKTVVGYRVTLYDTKKLLQTETTQDLQLQFKNLTQFSKYFVTVQVLSKTGYSPPSPQLSIQTKDLDECSLTNTPCNKNAKCVNSAGSYFCSCLPGYVGDGAYCKALPVGTTKSDFCPEERARNITWEMTYRGHVDKKLCPSGTTGISTRKCIKGNNTRSYWDDPNLSNCVSSWMAAVDDKIADPTLNSTAVGNFFLNLLDKNSERGLYGGDVIKSVEVIDILSNKRKNNEQDEPQTNPKSSEVFVENLVSITEKIISPNTLGVWKDIPKERRTENSVRMTESLEAAVVRSANTVDYSSIEKEHVSVRFGDVTSFESRYANLSSPEERFDEINSVRLPKSQQRLRKDSTGRTSVSVIKYKTIGEVLSAGDQRKSNDFLNAAVLSVTMDPPLPVPFQKPLEFLLKNKEQGKFDEPKCVFFNTTRYPGSWSTDGCIVFNISVNFTGCHCYHMTSFSVLMQVQDVHLSHSDELILGWITRVGLCISLIALALAFVTFLCLPRSCTHQNGSKCFKLCEPGYRPTYLKKVRGNIHVNLIFSLAVAEALFLWGIEKTQDKVTCYTVAASLHYLFLVAFHWMAAEGVILYLVLVKVFQRKSARKDKRMFMLICWGSPAVIVGISLAVGYENYLHERCCWLSVSHGLIWSFVGPALTIIMVNVFFLCCTFRVMGRRQKWDKKEINMVDRIKYWTKGAAIVTCLLGVTWVFGVFFIHGDSVVVAYLFNIFNVLQGLFIFVFHCLLDEKIRQQYYRVLCGVSSTESRSPTHSSGTVKKERRRSTFNSWLWSVVPIKYQESKSESCPTVAENTLRKINNSTHSLSNSPLVDGTLLETKQEGSRPRGLSSIYHDSDENMDNIPDKVLKIKHSSSKTSNVESPDVAEETSGSVFPFEDYWIPAISRENSNEFLHVPPTTCEDCLYEIRDWEEQQKIMRKSNSLHEQELKKLSRSRDEGLEAATEGDTQLPVHDRHDDDDDKTETTMFTSVLPHIIISNYASKNHSSKCYSSASPPRRYQLVRVTDSSGAEITPRKKLPCPTLV